MLISISSCLSAGLHLDGCLKLSSLCCAARVDNLARMMASQSSTSLDETSDLVDAPDGGIDRADDSDDATQLAAKRSRSTIAHTKLYIVCLGNDLWFRV